MDFRPREVPDRLNLGRAGRGIRRGLAIDQGGFETRPYEGS